MATKQDLVEAYSFSRRRLVTAFVSGAPGGREVEPSRPGRTIIGGVALAVLVAAGGAVAGILGSHQAIDWTQPALVSDKDTGADYVILPTDSETGQASDPVLRPVANITSAMLLLGPGLTHEMVSSGDIASQKRGAPIGILQAPATPPGTGSLIQTGWTACTGASATQDYGIKLSVSSQPGTTPAASDTAMVLSAGGKTYVVAQAGGGLAQPRAYSYEVRANKASDNVLLDVAKAAESDALPVSQSFIDLFPTGPALQASSFTVPQAGTKVSYASQLGASGNTTPKVGDYYRVPGDDRLRVLLPQGIARFDPFPAAVYRDTHPEARELKGITSDPALPAPPAPYDPSLWPTDVASAPVSGQRCAVLEASPGQLPSVELAPTTTGTPASAADVPADEHTSSVDSGHGAVVMSGGFGAADFTPGAVQPYLVDDRGFAYPLDGTARDQLGYTDVPDETVPDTWIKLFERGVPLSVDAARCPPTSSKDAKPCGT